LSLEGSSRLLTKTHFLMLSLSSTSSAIRFFSNLHSFKGFDLSYLT
jgi:hypothetical protein